MANCQDANKIIQIKNRQKMKKKKKTSLLIYMYVPSNRECVNRDFSYQEKQPSLRLRGLASCLQKYV